MTEQEALRFINSLPVDDRLRLMRQMLADMEGRVSRARAELAGGLVDLSAELAGLADPQPTLPGLELPPPDAAAAPPDPALAFAASEAAEPDEWSEYALPPANGGEGHEVHRQRLIDAAAQYEKLLKRYGYIRRQPTLAELSRRLRDEPGAQGPEGAPPRWAEWVAKDQERLDRPQTQDWQDWVAIGDDEPD